MVRCSTGPSDRNGSVCLMPRPAAFVPSWVEVSCIDFANEFRLRKDGRDEPMTYCFKRWSAQLRRPDRKLIEPV
jgi:hypothetical protein